MSESSDSPPPLLCGTIYLTSTDVFVTCVREAGHGGEWCTDKPVAADGAPAREAFTWKQGVYSAMEAAPSEEPSTSPVPEQKSKERAEDDYLAELKRNTITSYSVSVGVGTWRISPTRLDPKYLNDLDRHMIASMLRFAADRLEPRSAYYAIAVRDEDEEGV